MSSRTVRISSSSQTMLRELAERTGQTMQAVVEEAIEAYRRERFLAEANHAFAALRKDTRLAKEEAEERAAWDATLADGLEKD